MGTWLYTGVIFGYQPYVCIHCCLPSRLIASRTRAANEVQYSTPVLAGSAHGPNAEGRGIVGLLGYL